MISICPPQSPLLSRTGRFDIHLSEEKSFMVIWKFFFFKTLLHFLGEFLRKLPSYSQLEIYILKILFWWRLMGLIASLNCLDVVDWDLVLNHQYKLLQANFVCIISIKKNSKLSFEKSEGLTCGTAAAVPSMIVFVRVYFKICFTILYGF